MIRSATKDQEGIARQTVAEAHSAKDSSASSLAYRSLASPAIIVLAILITFGCVCAHEFTNWDDRLNVTYNPHLNPPGGAGLVYFWKHPYEHEYIPVTYTVWWLLAQVARVDTPDAAGIWLNPYIFHTVNLLLHLVVSLLVYQLLVLLTRRPWAACCGALLFALHPIQAEVVAWVTGLKDLLCAFFSILALWQYVLFARRQERDGSRRWHYAAATVALIAAMLAKPSAVTVPIIAASIDWLILKRSWRSVATAIGPWAAVSAVMVIIGILSHPTPADVGGPLRVRPLIAADSLAFYLGKILWPAGLSAVYHHSAKDLLAGPWLYLAWILPAALGVLVWIFRKRAPWLAAAAIIFVAAVLPVLGFVAFEFERISTVADRYVYVAMLGPSIAVAFALCSVRSHISIRSQRWLGAGGALAVLSLAMLTFRQARFWHDSRTLFTRVLEVYPRSDVAYSSLAADSLDYGRPVEAEGYARRAEQLNSDRPNNGITLGFALRAEGRYAEAGEEFRKVAVAHPDSPVALTNLAIELQRSGRFDKAIAIFRGLVAMDPQSSNAHHDLATVLMEQHKPGEALAEAAEAVRLNPESAENHLLYGKLLAMAGRRAEADQQLAAGRATAPGISEPIKSPEPGNPVPH